MSDLEQMSKKIEAVRSAAKDGNIDLRIEKIVEALEAIGKAIKEIAQQISK